MLCKRIAPTILALLLPLSLAALASLATMGSLGCSGSNDPAVVTPEPAPPPLSSEAGIAALSITPGELDQEFNPNRNNYSATIGLLGESTVGVTVTLADPKARLTVNNIVTASGARADVPLAEGRNVIQAMVTSEDGRVVNPITITIMKPAFNTRVYVLNGVGGMPYAGTLLTLTDSQGRVLAEDVPLPIEKNGEKVFALDPAKKYNIYAKAPGSAAGCFYNYDPARESRALIYCYRCSSTGYELEAPIITDISFAGENAVSPAGGWKNMPNGDRYIGPLADVVGVRVTALTRNIVYNGGGPLNAFTVPVRINIDEEAANNAGGQNGQTGTNIEMNVPVTFNGKSYYRTVQRFSTATLLSNHISQKDHYMDVVVFDAVGNRTRQVVHMTITDSAADLITEPDISGWVPTLTTAQAHSVAGGGDWNSAGPVHGLDFLTPPPAEGTANGYYEVLMGFYARNADNTALPIRGYEIWRSIGNENNFVKVATYQYATPSSLTTERQYYECGPELVVGDIYYKYRVYNGNPANGGYSQFSPSLKARMMPIAYTGPSASHKMVSDKLWPEFRIAPTDPRLLTKEVSDQFRFTLFIKGSTDPYPFLMIPFRMNLNPSAADTPTGWPAGKPVVTYQNITSYSVNTSSGVYTIAGTWLPAYDTTEVPGVDENGDPIVTTVYTPFVTLDADGSVVIATSSKEFQKAMDNRVRYYFGNLGETFMPGVTYLWNLFGDRGGISWSSASYPVYWTSNTAADAAYFAVGSNPSSPATWQGCSYGSHGNFSYGSPAGWFPLIIAADAK